MIFYNTVREAIESMGREAVITHHKQILEFFLVSFDLRMTRCKDFPVEVGFCNYLCNFQI